MKGIVELEIVNIHTGKRRKRRFTNVVVNGAKEQICHLLAGDVGSISNRRNIVNMQFGTGIQLEAVSDEILSRPITPIKAVNATYPNEDGSDDFYVKFSASLDANEGNGFPISEAGLLTGSNVLMARVTFGAETKSSDYIFYFNWTLYCQ